MAAVRSPGQKAMNRVAIAAVLVITLIFLAPIYWIASTAFKPRSLATTVPPTVFFQPEITPFIKLFTKRVQMTKPVDPQVYAAAPWWEQRIYDGGERVLRTGDTVQLSQYPNRFANSLIATKMADEHATIGKYQFRCGGPLFCAQMRLTTLAAHIADRDDVRFEERLSNNLRHLLRLGFSLTAS